MDFFRKLFKNKDKPVKQNIILIGALGIILLIVSSTLFKDNKKPIKDTSENTYEKSGYADAFSEGYESDIERRFENLLSEVEGVGKVKVMITLSYGKEIVLAEDTSTKESATEETDSQGGRRAQTEKSEDRKKIILQSSGGGQQPLVLKEIEPKAEGVVIVSEGGGNVLVKQALINTAVTVLGVEPHKVQVLKMKTEK